MTYSIVRETEIGLFTAIALVNGNQRIKLIIDTGATVTTIDSNVLYMIGYRPTDSIGIAPVETASGIIETDLYELSEFKLFGITKSSFVVQSHDFLEYGIVSDYSGLLGMDFFEGFKFCIDTVLNEITLHEK
jgi:predicted aspartyl protease